MNIPETLSYTKDHEWVRFDDDGRAVVGITEYAQHSLGDIVYVELPRIGTRIEAGETVATVESVKAVSDVYAPITGTVNNVNEELNDTPELINEDAYKAWIVKLSDWEPGQLLSAAEYAALLEKES
ncbi:MAG: glycine cleavage system protein GcvH [Christensenellales bacterium]|jgi:glycine cleavage system H protein